MAKDDFNIDANINNADWAKRTWDILPPTMEFLLQVLEVAKAPLAKQRQAVQEFMKLPAARAMPASLRKELQVAGLL